MVMDYTDNETKPIAAMGYTINVGYNVRDMLRADSLVITSDFNFLKEQDVAPW